MGQLRELIDKATVALMSGDIERYREVYAPDVVVTTPDAGTLHGVDALYEWNRGFIEAFSDMQWEELATYETADSVISQGALVGTHTKPFPLPDGSTVPPTGKQVRCRSADVARFENGKIARHDFYFDQVEVMSQLGLMEAPAPTQT